MANRIKLKGTSERSFDIGLGPKQVFDANNLTANRTWVLPDSNGTAGYVLSTDGTGNLSWTAQTGGGGGNSQARIQFTAASSGTGQTFADSNIGNFPNNTFANVFVNGVMLQTSEYSISGTTLTVSRYLTTGDNVIVAATSNPTITGTIGVSNGGTGITTYATGDTLYASATNTLAKLSIGSTGQVLTVASGIPSWATLPSNVSSFQTSLSGLTPSTSTTGAVTLAGTLGETSGGTNQTTYTTGDILYASGSNTLAKRAIGSTGQVLTVSGGVPAWATPASSGFSGVSRTSTLDLTSGSGTEQVISSVYTLPTISAGMAFRFSISVQFVGSPGNIRFRVRCGANGTTADTQIYNTTFSTGLTGATFDVIEGTIVFSSNTAVLNIFTQQRKFLGVISAQNIFALDGGVTSGTSGLTPTYMIITGEPDTGSALAYFRINQAMITRVL